jgi:hypothetical protein
VIAPINSAVAAASTPSAAPLSARRDVYLF